MLSLGIYSTQAQAGELISAGQVHGIREAVISSVVGDQARADGLKGEVAIRGRIWFCRGFYTVCNGSEEYREWEAARLESGASWASRDSGYTNGVLLYCS